MIVRVEELPFRRRKVLELFGIDRSRREPDLSGDYIEHGYATLDEVELAAASGPSTFLRDALVLVLHSPELDDPSAGEDELEVMLELRHGDDTVEVLVALARFLDARASSVIGDTRDVVLAFCNPHARRPSAPCWLVDGRRLHFATSDVVSWLDPLPDGRERIRLYADRWHLMTADQDSLI